MRICYKMTLFNTLFSFSLESWVGAVTSMVVVGVMGLGCIMLIPALKRGQHYEQVSRFLIALAVGTLAGDALVHLLPHVSLAREKGQGLYVRIILFVYSFQMCIYLVT